MSVCDVSVEVHGIEVLCCSADLICGDRVTWRLAKSLWEAGREESEGVGEWEWCFGSYCRVSDWGTCLCVGMRTCGQL
jgi:hypothetical protein